MSSPQPQDIFQVGLQMAFSGYQKKRKKTTGAPNSAFSMR